MSNNIIPYETLSFHVFLFIVSIMLVMSLALKIIMRATSKMMAGQPNSIIDVINTIRNASVKNCAIKNISSSCDMLFMKTHKKAAERPPRRYN